ncbi:MAG: class I SAM-dependent methyltransferase [Acidobacteriota bacterium]
MSRAERQKWEGRYSVLEPSRERTAFNPSEWLKHWCQKVPTGRALDLAAGKGCNSIYLARLGHVVYATDIALESVRIIRQRACGAGLSIHAWTSDLDAVSFRIERFDLVADFFYLNRDLLKAIRARLKRGGLFIMETYLSMAASDEVPEYVLQPGELREVFLGYQVLGYEESSRGDSQERWGRARIAARRP